MTRVFHWIAALSVATSALSGQAVRERDSAGVRIVVNSRPSRAFTLSSTPTCLVPAGGDRGDLTSAPSAFLLSDNRLVIANATERRIDFYSCAGKAALLSSRGRQGRGPGEFTNISSVSHARGDTLLVAQAYAGPVVVLDGNGNPVTNLATRGNVVCCFEDGSLLLGRSTPRTAAGAQSGFSYYRYHPATRTEDPGAVAFLPASQTAASSRTSRSGNNTVTSTVLRPAPFGRLSSMRIFGKSFVAGTGEAYAVGVYDSAGRPLESIRVEEAPRAVGAQEKSVYIADELRDLEGAERQRRESELARVAFPDRMPAYRRIEVDDHSCIWVEHYPDSDLANGVWDVFSDTGRLLGTLQIPAAARLMSVKWPNVVLRRTNADGFVEIAVYPIAGADLQVCSKRPDR